MGLTGLGGLGGRKKWERRGERKKKNSRRENEEWQSTGLVCVCGGGGERKKGVENCVFESGVLKSIFCKKKLSVCVSRKTRFICVLQIR